MSAAEPDIARRIENFDVFARQAGVAAFFFRVVHQQDMNAQIRLQRFDTLVDLVY
ncbi:hypothetical protein EPIRMAN_GEN20615_05130 [Ralstonia mannitolilytica]|nr:hypothetical protein R76706_01073 [Ralstonia mannitolilytica]CAJ0797394.1 hypothetical protein R77555_03062 [Ralstonia mannitolilytica]